MVLAYFEHRHTALVRELEDLLLRNALELHESFSRLRTQVFLSTEAVVREVSRDLKAGYAAKP